MAWASWARSPATVASSVARSTKLVETEYGPMDQERAAIWTRSGGWKTIADESFQGCDIFQTSVFDVNRDGSAAVGLAFEDCSHVYAFKWTREDTACASSARPARARRAPMPSRATATSSVAGKKFPKPFGFRVGSIWQGREQMLLTDPEPQNPIGYVERGHGGQRRGHDGRGLRRGRRAARTRTSGPARTAWSTSAATWATSATPYYDWETGEPIEVCEDRETIATSISNDGKVITGASRLLMLGIDDAAIYTRGLGWMLMNEFLASQGVLEMSRWQVLGARVSGDGKVLTGTAFPLAARLLPGLSAGARPGVRLSRQASWRPDDQSRLPGRDGCASEAWRRHRALPG